MDTYDRIMLSLKEQVGKGKRFESAADLAKFCKVDPSFVHKHLQGKIKGEKIRPLLEFLHSAGVDMTFKNPDANDDPTREVVFVNPRLHEDYKSLPHPIPDDYRAIPLTNMEVAAGPSPRGAFSRPPPRPTTRFTK